MSASTMSETSPAPLMASDCRPLHGHTEHDAAVLYAAGVDPNVTQPRDWPVRCICSARTFNVGGGCDRPSCYHPPAAAVRAEIERTGRDLAEALAAAGFIVTPTAGGES